MSGLAGAALWLSGFIIGAVVVAALVRRYARANRAAVIVDGTGRLRAWRGEIDVATVESWEAFQAAMDKGKTETEETGT